MLSELDFTALNVYPFCCGTTVADQTGQFVFVSKSEGIEPESLL